MRTLNEITKNDVAPGDRELYADFVAEAEIDLAPSGMLELCHAAHIIRALWRLRETACIDETDVRGEMRESIDRRIAAQNRIVKLNRQFLRELQTDRQLRNHFGLPVNGLASTRDFLRAEKQRSRPNPNPQPAPPPSPRAESPVEPPAESGIATLTSQIHSVEAALNHLLRDFSAPNSGFLNKRTHSRPAAAPDTPPDAASAPQAPPKAA